MTSVPVSTPAAFPFVAHLRERMPEIAAGIVAEVLTTVPDYQEFPPGLIEAQMTAAAEANLRLFLRSLERGGELGGDELDELIEVAVRRAREGVPLDTVLSVYHRGAISAWRAVAALSRTPHEREQLLATVPHLLAYLGAVTPGVAASYLRERQDLHWEQREAKRAVAQALLQGKQAELLAARFGIPLDGGFHVLVFRLTAPASARPSLRAVHAEIDTLSPKALTMLERTGGCVLVPSGAATTPSRLDAIVARIATAADVRTVAGAALADAAHEVAAKAEEAGEIAALAAGLGRPTGVYRMADLALQYQLARPGPARSWLLGLLHPLAEHRHLLEALRAFISHDYHRLEAAAALVVHRNTLNYRLARIAELTGYDPGRPEHAQLFAAALIASDLEGAGRPEATG
ncbi:PucR family transcriptional regulator [Nocardia mexicana]|uniref:PucR-like helix-turn-helix protein n=1 Tax=Nocardia mexicana TaxID=279262 RepID=A0A370H367_9NOCA|nr:PucR family transcriptional regulator [Nocardia mexicana]RDI50603.1 PucR-like helix-turn-helix protein [Nocardia mexicana]